MVETARLRCEAIAWVIQDWPGRIRVRLIDVAHQSTFLPLLSADARSSAKVLARSSPFRPPLHTLSRPMTGRWNFRYAAIRSSNTRLRKSDYHLISSSRLARRARVRRPRPTQPAESLCYTAFPPMSPTIAPNPALVIVEHVSIKLFA
jgi:hypothetical protein